MTCRTCGSSPCVCAACPPSTLNQPRIFSPVVSNGQFQNGAYQSPAINGGTATGQAIIGATIDCTTSVCTQPPGTCNSTVASTAFVCVAIDDAISATNPQFCNAVNLCIAQNFALACPAVASCIATTPNIINTTAAFGPLARATDTAYGVVRFATLSEALGAQCSLALEPCDLAAMLASVPDAGPFWTAFTAAVGQVLSAFDFCAATAPCGYAPLASPAFTGTPTAPTPPTGDNSNRIATTAFVHNQIAATVPGLISAAIDSANPAFCSAVAGCLSGSGNQAFASSRIPNPPGVPVFTSGCTVTFIGITLPPYQAWDVVFATPQPDTNYNIIVAENFGIFAPQTERSFAQNRTTNGFTLQTSTLSNDIEFVCVRV